MQDGEDVAAVRHWFTYGEIASDGSLSTALGKLTPYDGIIEGYILNVDFSVLDTAEKQGVPFHIRDLTKSLMNKNSEDSALGSAPVGMPSSPAVSQYTCI
jgi:hypothetical protein